LALPLIPGSHQRNGAALDFGDGALQRTGYRLVAGDASHGRIERLRSHLVGTPLAAGGGVQRKIAGMYFYGPTPEHLYGVSTLWHSPGGRAKDILRVLGQQLPLVLRHLSICIAGELAGDIS
jgi:hypothetical protein